MNYQHILEKASEYVRGYYKEHGMPALIYHNLQHTEDVVTAATRIANHYQLDDADFFIVVISAWFHDLGYMVDIMAHEEKGADIAAEFLMNHRVSDNDIQLVRGCILATKMPQSPKTLLEEIVCDADVFHLGTDDFAKKDKLMHSEVFELYHKDLNKQEWRRKTILFLESHHYFTEYCKVLLNDTKNKHLQELKEKVAKADKKTNEESTSAPKEAIAGTQEEMASPKKKKNSERPDKGIETMFRISSSNHQRLSDMADRKAHIMITVNSIILSAIISLVLRRLNEYGYLIVPSFILLGISVAAMTFAILSTRPSIPNGVFSREDVDNKKVNLLFFGNFYKMKLDEFNYGMEQMMEDKQFLYGSLIKDLYAQGIVLGKKYHLLRVSYNVFMYGLIIAVFAFIIASAFFSPNAAL
ncbi:Pycsar system effector family protein [Mucilaginibacter sp.]|jgi:predicted metal-dependent HD superfamily phosphohydrolase|uniref:Pycsar system effector family protein n=1 Tax=Mucilaginibacter sp. TaxID=1882438 RepID=UPI002CDBBDE8|nr:Pycsar system effector family protein [Mucilaginibacter sp.]HTI58905.1 Pycsar system effector family protein [Mucilaginibacter sp.]